MGALAFRPCMGQLATSKHSPVRPHLVRDILSSLHASHPVRAILVRLQTDLFFPSREIRWLETTLVAYVSASDRGDNRCLQNAGRTLEVRSLNPLRLDDYLPSFDHAEREQERLAHESSRIHFVSSRRAHPTSTASSRILRPTAQCALKTLTNDTGQARRHDHKASAESSRAVQARYTLAMYCLRLRSSDPRESI